MIAVAWRTQNSEVNHCCDRHHTRRAEKPNATRIDGHPNFMHIEHSPFFRSRSQDNPSTRNILQKKRQSGGTTCPVKTSGRHNQTRTCAPIEAKIEKAHPWTTKLWTSFA
jgi:hypothetical protein